MKPKLFKIPKKTNHPISAQYEYSERQYKKFHFHEEIQITLVKKGRGIVLCGNTNVDFKEGSLLIFGSNVSHVFVGEGDESIESISIYFNQDWLRSVYQESHFLEHFIKQSQRGIHVERFKYIKQVEEVLNKSGLVRIISFFQLLENIGATPAKEYITSLGTLNTFESELDSSRLNVVYEYISANYTREIKLDKVAELANMTPHAFCRYFKQRTQKTLTQFIMELRINYACKILQETELSVEEVCYKSGYNNFSNFIRQFRKIKNLTPKTYRNDLKQLIHA